MSGFLNWYFGNSVSVIVPGMVHTLRALYMPARISLHVMEQPSPAQLHCTRIVKSCLPLLYLAKFCVAVAGALPPT